MQHKIYWSLIIGVWVQANMGCGLTSQGDTSKAPSQSDITAADALGGGIPMPIGGGIEFYRPSFKTSKVEQTAAGSNYELAPESFPRERVAEFQKPGTDKTGTPKDLQGIWWMDGNAACSCTVSFAEVDFSAENPIMSNFSENNFSYQGGKAPEISGRKGDPSYESGTKSFHSATLTNSVYEFHFKGTGNARYQQADIMPVMKIDVFGVPLSIRVKPSLIRFGFKKVNDDMYLRENFVFGVKAPGGAGEYHFKRILKPSASSPDQLEKTTYWNEFAGAQQGKKVVPPAMLRLPQQLLP